jgi:hypothetical protein
MASIIRIKRSSVSGNPNTLGAGELAYSNLTDNGSNGGDRLYIGMGTESNGNAANHVVIGGKFFTDRLDHAAGTLTANSALVVDSDSKIDNLLVDNLQLNGNTISSTDTNGNIVLTPNGSGYVTISGTNALVIPKGTSAQQAPQLAGAIRFNTDNTAFEGYDGTNWSSLGGVKSVDQNTYVTAANNGDIDFYSDTVNVATVNGDGLDIKSTTATDETGTTGALKVAGGASIQGNLFVGGNLYGIDDVSSNAYLAAQGAPNAGTTGYSFMNDDGYDTGMFSAGNGQLSLYSNGDEILYLQGTSDSYLKTPTLHLGTNYGTISANSQEIVLNPDSDNDYARLRIATWLSNGNIGVYNDGGKGLTLGNWDNGDSFIDIAGSSGSVDYSSDDITIRANRDGVVRLETNNNDITLANDYGTVTFRNSDGHLVIPGVIETNNSTGDVTLASSDGTEKNLVFKQDGSLALPNVGIDFYDSNNIGGNRVGEFRFDGGDLYVDSYNGSFSVWAADDYGWTFNTSGQLQLPGNAILSTVNNNSVLLGNGVQETGSSQRVSIGYQPDGQTGESWDAIAIGSRAGTTNQGNNAIAMGNRAGYTGQGNDAIAIGSSPNSSVGGAGYSNQGQYAVAIGAQAGETDQGTNTVALGYFAGNSGQGFKSVAIGDNAGQSSQGFLSVAIGAHAGDTSQGHSSVALGHTAGRNSQGSDAVAIGVGAGLNSQGNYAVAIGERAGYGDNTAQGAYSIALGSMAGFSSQHDNSIAINASGNELNPSEAGLYIDPIRNVTGSQYLTYNSDTKEVTYNTSTLQISGDTISSTATDGNIIIEPNGTGHISVSNAQIKNVAEPTDDTDVATKYYVDAARSGLDVKASVRLATTADITLSGVQTIDTKTTATGQRILVKDQESASENGIYVANDVGAWTRATDFDTNTEVTSGAFTFVEDGSVNQNAGFVVTTKVVDVGTTAIDWTLFSASGTLIAGDGLVKSGYTLAVNVASDGGIEINSDSLRLKSSLAGDGLTYADGVLSIGGTSNRIVVNADSIDIDAAYVGQTSITTLGTITSGTWNGNTIGSGYGGTGFSSYSKGDIIYASATNTLSKLNGGDSGKVLQMSDTGVPTWGDIDGGTY